MMSQKLAIIVMCAVFTAFIGMACSGETETESEPEWQELFNGTDMAGWTFVGDGSFEVEDGKLKTVGGMGLLYYDAEAFENVIIHVEYMPVDSANSGVFIRIPEKPDDPWFAVHNGYEVQIDDTEDDSHVTGVLYSFTETSERPGISDDWNEMRIRLEGNRTVVHVNGVLLTDFTDGDPVPEQQEWWEPERGPRPDKGYIGLQNHGGDDVVYFRRVAVKPIEYFAD